MTGSAALVSAGGAIGMGRVVVVVVEVVDVVVGVVLVVVEGVTVVVVEVANATSTLPPEHAPVTMAVPTPRTMAVKEKRRDIVISLPVSEATRWQRGHHQRYTKVCRFLGTTILRCEENQAEYVQSR